MRWLVDECVSRIIVGKLRSTGHDVLFVTELIPSSADTEVFSFASGEHRILLTQDMDFGEILFRDRFPALSGVILFRMRLRSKPFQWARLSTVIEEYGESLTGRYTVIEDARVRSRALK